MRMPGRSAKNNSGEIARTRLKLLLVSDQSGVNPGIIGMIRDDLVRVLSRYAQIDAGADGTSADPSQMRAVKQAFLIYSGLPGPANYS